MGTVRNPKILRLSSRYSDKETRFTVIRILKVIMTTLGRTVLTNHKKDHGIWTKREAHQSAYLVQEVHTDAHK